MNDTVKIWLDFHPDDNFCETFWHRLQKPWVPGEKCAALEGLHLIKELRD